MKAIYIDEQGDLDHMIYGDVPEPEIGPTDFLVKARASSLNRRDLFVREGSHGMRTQGRTVLGMDGSGEVVKVGDLCRRLKVGDRVMGVSGGAMYAEYVRMPEAATYVFPDDVSFEEAAAVPIAFVTAWHMMVCRAHLAAGEDVLVMAGGSGVGSAAIQIAKLHGDRVFTTASTEDKLEKARALGADFAINYRDEDFSVKVKELTDGEGVDLVFEHIGAPVWDQCYASLKRGGRFVTCGVSAGHRVQLHLGQLWTRDLTLIGTSMRPPEDMPIIAKLLARKQIHGVVSEVFPLADAAKAQQRLEDSDFFGKVILSIP